MGFLGYNFNISTDCLKKLECIEGCATACLYFFSVFPCLPYLAATCSLWIVEGRHVSFSAAKGQFIVQGFFR